MQLVAYLFSFCTNHLRGTERHVWEIGNVCEEGYCRYKLMSNSRRVRGELEGAYRLPW